jgi:hypothetical protein
LLYDAAIHPVDSAVDMSAQNQHYVPKFVLRQFLSNERREQVSVYDKHADRAFTTSIRNIMAERRFNDFVFDEWSGSFEPIATKIEHFILPRYSKIIEQRRLEGTPDEKADLSFLIAFQMLRTKGHRDMRAALENQIRKKVEAIGGQMEQLEGWTPGLHPVSKTPS